MSKKSKKKEEYFGSKDVQFITEEEKKKCHVIIHAHAVAAGAGNVVPIPGAGILADLGTMTTMAMALSKVFNDKPLDKAVALSLMTGIAKRVALKYPIRMLAKEASKLLPVLGQVVAPSISIGMIESAGWVLVNQFAKERHDRKEEAKARAEANRVKEELNAKADSMFEVKNADAPKPLVISDVKSMTTGLPTAEVLVTKKEEEIKKPFLASKVNLSNAGKMKLINSEPPVKKLGLDNLLTKDDNSIDILGTKSNIGVNISSPTIPNINHEKISQLESDLKQLTIDRTNNSSLEQNTNNLRSSTLIDRSRFIRQDKKALKLEDDLKSFVRQRDM